MSTPTPPGDSVERAKAALAGATAGPWFFIPGDDEEASVISEGEQLPDPITVGGITFNPGFSVAVDLRNGDAEFIAASRTLIPELIAEVERLHSWDGLMSLLDEHYPVDIFPTMEDRPDRDPGPRIVSLLRVIDELRAAVGLGPEPPSCPGPGVCDGRCGPW